MIFGASVGAILSLVITIPLLYKVYKIVSNAIEVEYQKVKK
jgi:hypothetical protein